MRYREDTERAFHWILDILAKHRVPYQVTGGMAAKIYGSNRPLLDIDIDIPEDRFAEIVVDLQPYIQLGPKMWRGEGFKVYLITLRYKGQDIDIGGAYRTQIWNRAEKRWVPCTTDLNRYSMKLVLGRRVRVIRKDDLIAYKSMLDRRVDRVDLGHLAH